MQSATVKHGSAMQPVPLSLPSPRRPGGQMQTNSSPSRESMQVDPPTQSASPLEHIAIMTLRCIINIGDYITVTIIIIIVITFSNQGVDLTVY